MKQEVLRFISRFTMAGKREEVVEAFTTGCCYWFAFTLVNRFPECSALVYDEIENHFAAEIEGRVYDITGDVTGKYHMIQWSQLADETHKQRIIRDCIMF